MNRTLPKEARWRCNTLQHTATHRNTLQHIATHYLSPERGSMHSCIRTQIDRNASTLFPVNHLALNLFPVNRFAFSLISVDIPVSICILIPVKFIFRWNESKLIHFSTRRIEMNSFFDETYWQECNRGSMHFDETFSTFVQPITDRVSQHLEIISKTFPTNQNSVHGIYD